MLIDQSVWIINVRDDYGFSDQQKYNIGRLRMQAIKRFVSGEYIDCIWYMYLVELLLQSIMA